VNFIKRSGASVSQNFHPEPKSASFITSTIKYLRTLPLNGDLHVNVTASASSEYSQPLGSWLWKGQRSRQVFARKIRTHKRNRSIQEKNRSIDGESKKYKKKSVAARKLMVILTLAVKELIQSMLGTQKKRTFLFWKYI